MSPLIGVEEPRLIYAPNESVDPTEIERMAPVRGQPPAPPRRDLRSGAGEVVTWALGQARAQSWSLVHRIIIICLAGAIATVPLIEPVDGQSMPPDVFGMDCAGNVSVDNVSGFDLVVAVDVRSPLYRQLPASGTDNSIETARMRRIIVIDPSAFSIMRTSRPQAKFRKLIPFAPVHGPLVAPVIDPSAMSVFGAPITDLASVPLSVNGHVIVNPPPVKVRVFALVAVNAPPGLMLTVAAVAALVIAASDAATTVVSSSVRRVRMELLLPDGRARRRCEFAPSG